MQHKYHFVWRLNWLLFSDRNRDADRLAGRVRTGQVTRPFTACSRNDSYGRCNQREDNYTETDWLNITLTVVVVCSGSQQQRRRQPQWRERVFTNDHPVDCLRNIDAHAAGTLQQHCCLCTRCTQRMHTLATGTEWSAFIGSKMIYLPACGLVKTSPLQY